MEIQWYPGHMAKAERLMREEARKADIIFLVGDARAVKQSINKKFASEVKDKRIAYIYNKCGLCDPEAIKKWKAYFEKNNINAFFTDCIEKKGLADIAAHMQKIKTGFRYERDLRAIIAGIPNVGKSMLINALAGKASAKTGNMPGVTRGSNWVRAAGEFYLLDTPGVLPPKFEGETDGVVLASIGCIKDTAFNIEDLALKQLEFLAQKYNSLISSRYKISTDGLSPVEMFDAICESRGFLLKRGLYDYERCARTVTDEFKNGKIGKIAFSWPEDRI